MKTFGITRKTAQTAVVVGRPAASGARIGTHQP